MEDRTGVKLCFSFTRGMLCCCTGERGGFFRSPPGTLVRSKKIRVMSCAVKQRFQVERDETAYCPPPPSPRDCYFENPFQKSFLKCPCIQNFYLAVLMHFIVTHELLPQGAADWFSD